MKRYCLTVRVSPGTDYFTRRLTRGRSPLSLLRQRLFRSPFKYLYALAGFNLERSVPFSPAYPDAVSTNGAHRENSTRAGVSHKLQTVKNIPSLR